MATIAADRGPSTAVVQRSAILKHEYRELENPAYTVAHSVAWATGLPEAQVFSDIDKGPAGTVPHDKTLARPDRVVAYIDRKSGSGTRTSVITQIGHLGNLEEVLRGRGEESYNGGHLLALELFKSWNLINDPSNLAPQRASDNQAPGEWRRTEIWLDAGTNVIYEAAVSYPDRTYTVTVGGMGSALKANSTSATALANASFTSRWFPWTVNTWSPNQYSVVVTPTSTDAPTTHTNAAGWDPTNWLPGLHRLASPIKGTLARLIPLGQIIERHGGFIGGVDVRTQQNHPYADALNEFKQLAIDLAKITGTIGALGWIGIDLSAIGTFAAGISGIGALATVLPGFLGTAPLAAILIYAVTHQLNLTRLIPELPGLNWLKYLLGLIGL